MKTIRVEKEHSWLQWPVTVKNCTVEPLHLTAKYFGKAEINEHYVEGVLKRFKELCTIDPARVIRDMIWRPEKFSDLVYVLESGDFPKAFKHIHDEFCLIKDAYEPYRPHITVPVDYWEFVKATGATPQSENLRFGELELCLGQV